MPHRKNAKGDIGSLKRFSDTYDMDNVYLSEEGWVYRHYKNSEKTLWWDEILVAGQVKPGMEIHAVSNNPVSPTNPYKLGTDTAPAMETGDGNVDIDYSDHERAADKITEFDDDAGTDKLYNRTDFQETAWSSINVEDPEYLNPDGSQVPLGWAGVSSPKDSQDPPRANTGEDFQAINNYNLQPDNQKGPYNGTQDPWQENAEVMQGNYDETKGPRIPDGDYTGVPDSPWGNINPPTPPVNPDPTPPDVLDPGVPVQQEE